MSENDPKVSPKRKDRSQQIKEVARRLFREKGFDNVTMREIAREIGIGVNVIYRNTESKSAVLADILRDYIQTEISVLKEMPIPKGSGLDRLMSYLEKLYELDLEDFEIRRLGVALSWSWGRERDAEFEELIGLELFAPINKALDKVGCALDYDARWAVWAIYTEGLRRVGMEGWPSQEISKDLKIAIAQQCAKKIRPQIQFIIDTFML
jgi:AcrR family transcriptional regulator